MSEANHHDSPPPPGREEEEGTERSPETPSADAAEQHTPVSGGEEPAAEPEWPREVPFDADPADAADQRRRVELDEDDYR
jgi:hypothetical protein